MGVKTFFSYPNELLIWGYPENFAKIRFVVEAADEFCSTGGDGTGQDKRARHPLQ